ncbi:MAG TPA: protein kinase [Kiritimatiellia bacterium]|nr:protein kinase [Kiritimatiellia bacterium]
MAGEESNQPRIAGRYELREKIGEGGAGLVYKAWDAQLQRFVAFKRLKGHHFDTNTESLLKEAKTLAAIQHPNILTIHDCGADENGPYVVTEFLQGKPLDEHVRTFAYDARSVGDLITQTLDGLIAAHHVHVIHRDLKPSNIMAIPMPSGAWQYKILDFGLARIVNAPTPQTLYEHNSIYGSVHCLAPEQIRRQALDERTDLYAMGCVYYFVISGRPPFDGDTILDVITAHIEHRVLPLDELKTPCAPDLCAWVMRLIAPDPAQRPPSAREALDEVRPLLLRGGGGTLRVTRAVPAPSATRPPLSTATMQVDLQPPRSPRRRLALISVGAIALVLLAAGGWWMTARAPRVVAPAPPKIDMPDYFVDMERADLLRQHFDRIKDLNFNFNSVGTVAEALAFLMVREQYAGQTNIDLLHSIHFHGRDGKEGGELDVVVMQKNPREAIAVYEVKVSDNLPDALSKGRAQLRRFQGFVSSNVITRIQHPADETRLFRPDQFDEIQFFGHIGSVGARDAGYDMEIDLTRAEATQLHKAVQRYKKLVAASSAAP